MNNLAEKGIQTIKIHKQLVRTITHYITITYRKSLNNNKKKHILIQKNTFFPLKQGAKRHKPWPIQTVVRK